MLMRSISSTSANATATSAFNAAADATSGTLGLLPGISLLPFSQPTPATFDIDLMSDFGTNPASAYAVQFMESGNVNSSHFAQAVVHTQIRTNLPGVSNLFSTTATVTWQNGVTSFTAGSFSPLIPQPIFASDYIAGPDGMFSLDPNKRHISIPFTIPAGQSFQFAILTDSNVQIVPEPASIISTGMGLIGLLVVCRRTKSRQLLRFATGQPIAINRIGRWLSRSSAR